MDTTALLDQLTEVFLEQNKQINLSAIRDAQGVKQKHIADSLEALKVITFKNDTDLVDVGTGGGFPLLPLAISSPQCQFTGLDSTKKKLVAIDQMVTKLGLDNVQTLWTRMENCSQTFDYLTARAVSKVDQLLSRCTPLVKKSGYLLIYKQANKEEKKLLHTYCKKLRLRFIKEHYYTLGTDDIQRVIYLLQKK